jgi:hypothetical protein
MPGLAFQEQVEALAAETQVFSSVAPRTAEVLDLKRASIIRSTSRTIEAYRQLTSHYFMAVHELSKKFEAVKLDEPTPRIVESVAALRRLLVVLSRPTVVDRDGDNILDMLDTIAAEWAKRSSSEGRYVRRQLKKVREAAAPCDVQRLRLLPIVIGVLAEAEDLERQWCVPVDEPDDSHAFDELFEASISDHSVITAYLAR